MLRHQHTLNFQFIREFQLVPKGLFVRKQQLRENEQEEAHAEVEQLPRIVKRNIKLFKMPQLQKPAPAFAGTAVVNGVFKDIKLSDYKGKYLVLFFYPLDFTFVCPTEIIAFSESAAEFRKINCEVIGCSTDSQFTHLAWINTPRKQGGLGSMDIPLLADKSMKVARDYGVLDEETGIPFRGLFIIDDKQNLRQITVNDLPVGRSVEETLRLVQAFQYTDKYGEVCPANWKPGQKTMVADPTKSKEYFETTS
ncbi:peroxiredoxin 1 [Drosophila sechellia]|nr:peroxiredoxin 1 [Drosophila sechellia]